ncbi:MAG: acetate/propionate family kinase [Gammaproteobacteria bacterium]|nr:acetate/propionate family kinase [Gammaproteobacteria bacterium]
MKQENPTVLVMNGGSSSLKFALYRLGDSPQRQWHGKVDRIGLRGTTLTFDDIERNQHDSGVIGDFDHRAAANFMIDWLGKKISLTSIAAVGHRVVNGGAHYHEPQRVTPELLGALRGISAYAPEHLPAEIGVIDLFHQRVPDLAQIVCFDTAFHRAMPRVAKILPIPRRLQAQGVERYGFHGLSYAFLMDELTRVAGEKAAHGKVVLAHLGNGASLAAVHGGKSIDTSMGFTPAAGVPMGTRSGDLDPGLVWYLAQTEHMTAEQFHHMVNHESGLLGVSETSSDLRDLLAHEVGDMRAAEAVALFCYQIKKCIGALAAALGGLDTLVFAGGIGENAAVIRARICAGLEFLGIEIEENRNATNAGVISTHGSSATVRVMRTDEEAMIAKSVYRVLHLSIEKENAHGREDKKS